MNWFPIRVICKAESHEPKEAIVGRIEIEDRNGEPHVMLSGALEGDDLLDLKRMHGSVLTPPDWEYVGEHPHDARRQRGSFVCPLCGLNVPMRQETALKLAIGLRLAGEGTVTLGALAATLG